MSFHETARLDLEEEVQMDVCLLGHSSVSFEYENWKVVMRHCRISVTDCEILQSHVIVGVRILVLNDGVTE